MMHTTTSLSRDRRQVIGVISGLSILSALSTLQAPTLPQLPTPAKQTEFDPVTIAHEIELEGHRSNTAKSGLAFSLPQQFNQATAHFTDQLADQLDILPATLPFLPQTNSAIAAAWNPLPNVPGIFAEALFSDNSDSLVAKAVGSAEGTRQPNGATNRAYFGHVDPGNAVWNIGTFSYQHCGNCAPEEADRRQLRRLAKQFAQINQYARDRYGFQLSLEEQLNAIDLANQAPLAALAQGGFIDRLQEAKQQGLTGSQAILQARVYSYKNPITNRWEAPGLGNTKRSITRDQARRQDAIARTVQANQTQIAQLRLSGTAIASRQREQDKR